MWLNPFNISDNRFEFSMKFAIFFIYNMPRGGLMHHWNQSHSTVQIHLLLLLGIGTESPADLIINITDPSEKPGSILTTLIDGFLLPKVPQQVEETEKTDPTNNNNIAIKESEQEITEGGFPVTNILSGIYR